MKKLGEYCDVRDGTHESPKFVENGFIEISKRSYVENGDILFAMIGTIGSPVLVSKECEFAIKNIALFKVGGLQKSISNNFLYNLLQYISDDLNRKSSGGTQKFVGLSFLRAYKILVPPLPEQEKIAEILGCWDLGIEKLSALIDAKKQRKKGLMQQLLTGQIRVKVA